MGSVRRQLYDLADILRDQGDVAGVVAAADTLQRKLIAAEEELVQLRVTGTGQDGVRWPARISERLRQATDVAAFNRMLQQRNLPAVIMDGAA